MPHLQLGNPAYFSDGPSAPQRSPQSSAATIRPAITRTGTSNSATTSSAKTSAAQLSETLNVLLEEELKLEQRLTITRLKIEAMKEERFQHFTEQQKLKKETIEQSRESLVRDGCTAWESRVYVHNKKKEVSLTERRRYERDCDQVERVAQKVSCYSL